MQLNFLYAKPHKVLFVFMELPSALYGRGHDLSRPGHRYNCAENDPVCIRCVNNHHSPLANTVIDSDKICVMDKGSVVEVNEAVGATG
jgi:hypothetical protein